MTHPPNEPADGGTPPANLPETLPDPVVPERVTPRKDGPSDTIDISAAVAIYLRTLSSPQTIKTYNTEIRMFISYVEEELGVEFGSLGAEELSLYREHLIKSYAPATAAKKLTAMRRFLLFTYMGGVTKVNPEALRFFAKSPRVPEDSSYNVLTEDELSRILGAARVGNYRDYILLAVMASCGLREAEVAGVKIEDFREVGDQVQLKVSGKGGRIRNVPASPDLWQLVQRYVLLSGRSLNSRADARRPLIESREGNAKPLTTRSIRHIVKKYVEKAAINKAISPHSIRHTVGTNMAVNEAPLLVIQQFLGHSDPKTTMRYIRRAEELANKAYQYNTLPI